MNGNDISGIEAINESQHEFTEPFQLQEVVYESTKFSHIFYAKKTMKQLLEERSQISSSLNLKMKKTNSLRDVEADEILLEKIIKIFEECPSKIDSFSLITFNDCLGYYSFFSTDGKFVPLCKECNMSIYTVTRNASTKLICCNPKCKKKILGENIFVEDESKTSKSKTGRVSTLNKSKSSIAKEELQKKVLSQKDIERIKKASQKIIFPH